MSAVVNTAVDEALVAEYVNLCEQLAAVALIDQPAERQLYERLDRLGLFDRSAEQRVYEKLDQCWYAQMTADDRVEAQDRLTTKTRQWHDARRTEDP